MDRRTFLKATALLMLPACSRAADSRGANFPAVGAAFPAFELADQDGVAVTSKTLQGSYAVVEFIRSGDW